MARTVCTSHRATSPRAVSPGAFASANTAAASQRPSGEKATSTQRPLSLFTIANTFPLAAFKKATTKVVAAPPKQVAVPGVREQVTLRIDQDVLEHFQAGGPGWQDRINDALRKAIGK